MRTMNISTVALFMMMMMMSITVTMFVATRCSEYLSLIEGPQFTIDLPHCTMLLLLMMMMMMMMLVVMMMLVMLVPVVNKKSYCFYSCLPPIAIDLVAIRFPSLFRIPPVEFSYCQRKQDVSVASAVVDFIDHQCRVGSKKKKTRDSVSVLPIIIIIIIITTTNINIIITIINITND